MEDNINNNNDENNQPTNQVPPDINKLKSVLNAIIGSALAMGSNDDGLSATVKEVYGAEQFTSIIQRVKEGDYRIVLGTDESTGLPIEPASSKDQTVYFCFGGSPTHIRLCEWHNKEDAPGGYNLTIESLDRELANAKSKRAQELFEQSTGRSLKDDANQGEYMRWLEDRAKNPPDNLSPSDDFTNHDAVWKARFNGAGDRKLSVLRGMALAAIVAPAGEINAIPKMFQAYINDVITGKVGGGNFPPMPLHLDGIGDISKLPHIDGLIRYVSKARAVQVQGALVAMGHMAEAYTETALLLAKNNPSYETRPTPEARSVSAFIVSMYLAMELLVAIIIKIGETPAPSQPSGAMSEAFSEALRAKFDSALDELGGQEPKPEN